MTSLRSLRAVLAMLLDELVDATHRLIVAALDPDSRRAHPAHPAARPVWRPTVLPTQHGAVEPTAPTAAEEAVGRRVADALAAGHFTTTDGTPVPPPPVTKRGRAKHVQVTCPICAAAGRGLDAATRLPYRIVPAASIAGIFFNNAPERSWYAFTCPVCDERIAKAADDDAVRVALCAAATAITVQDIPAEELEPHPVKPLTLDDCIDASAWLDTHDDLAAAAADASQHRNIDLSDGDR